MLASHLADRDELVGARGVATPGSGAWRPADAAEALAILDRVSRYCSFSCNPDGADCTDACEAWNLERAAAAYLAGRWLDVQD